MVLLKVAYWVFIGWWLVPLIWLAKSIFRAATGKPRPAVRRGVWKMPDWVKPDIIVVGTQYYSVDHPRRKGRIFPVEIVREPENLHDTNALAVRYQGETLGHVSASRAEALAPILDYAKVARIATRARYDGPDSIFVAMIYKPDRLLRELQARS